MKNVTADLRLSVQVDPEIDAETGTLVFRLRFGQEEEEPEEYEFETSSEVRLQVKGSDLVAIINDQERKLPR